MLRNRDSHMNHCTLVEEDESGAASKMYGINRNSILNQLKNFHECNGADIMHDILEGSLQYEVKLLLHADKITLILQFSILVWKIRN